MEETLPEKSCENLSERAMCAARKCRIDEVPQKIPWEQNSSREGEDTAWKNRKRRNLTCRLRRSGKRREKEKGDCPIRQSKKRAQGDVGETNSGPWEEACLRRRRTHRGETNR